MKPLEERQQRRLGALMLGQETFSFDYVYTGLPSIGWRDTKIMKKAPVVLCPIREGRL